MAKQIGLDAYVRVSDTAGREGASFISPKVQREQIEAWAKLKKIDILEVIEDMDQSGGKLDRPGLQRILQRVETGQSGGIVVAKLDRFARSLTGALETIKRIHDAGGEFVSVAEGIDPTTPSGKLQMNLMLMLAEFELDRVREQWSIAREQAIDRGVYISARPPTGYVRGEDKSLQIDERVAPFIREAYKMRAAGARLRAIADFLADNDVETSYGPFWTTRSVRQLLANDAYLGVARSGEFANENAHEAIVDRKLFDEANKLINVEVRRSPGKANEMAEPLLTGIIRCAGCRYLMKPDAMTVRSTGERQRLYRCRGEHAMGKCPDRAATLAHVVEPVVEKQFWEAVGNLHAQASHSDEDVARLEREASDAEAELEAYRDESRLVGVLGPDRFVEGLERRMAVLDQANRALAEARAEHSDLLPSRQELRRLWPDFLPEEKRAMFKSVFDAVMLRSGQGVPIEERIFFLYKGQMPDDFPRRGIQGPVRSFSW